MIIIGDVHGKFDRYQEIAQTHIDSIQVGDMGIGFGQKRFIDVGGKFIRGNHDNPFLCRETPGYLGDFGMTNNVFFVSGAASVDKFVRTEHIDWWTEEELTSAQANKCFDMYRVHNPRVVVSHDCPQSIAAELFGIKNTSFTRKLLQALLDHNKPDIWVFGHHHVNQRKTIGTTEFIALGELSTVEIQP